ncbi:glycosyltransferase family 4 protein [Mucisphaera sp.]|uniref:glycosyltransferase family 4 protein n=1 Tax=Mucisphaera sp. TaxID=2913024 RepID=UPI003D1110E5
MVTSTNTIPTTSTTDRLGGRSVLIAHPHRHHLYHTAHAYEEVDRLAEYLTRVWVGKPARLRPLEALPLKAISQRANRLRSYHDNSFENKAHVVTESLSQYLAFRALGTRRITRDTRRFSKIISDRAVRLNAALHMPCCYAKATFEIAKDQGITTILDQYTSDRRSARRMVEEDAEYFGMPIDKKSMATILDKSIELNEAEYELADFLVTGCQFSADTLIAAGVPAEKIIVTEYGADIETFTPTHNRRNTNEKLHIAFIGSGVIRKGLLHLLEAANAIGPQAVHIHIFGNHEMPESRRKRYTEVCTFYGHISRAQLNHHMARCHAFALPSLAERGGMSTYEAQAAGLPGIVTPNMGQIVRHKVNGFVVPAQQSAGIQEAIQYMLDNEDHRLEMTHAAVQAAKAQTWDRYGHELRQGLGLPQPATA